MALLSHFITPHNICFATRYASGSPPFRPVLYSVCMKTSDLQKYLQRIPAWPKEAQDELVRSIAEIEHRYSELYHVDDQERAALERSAEDVRNEPICNQ